MIPKVSTKILTIEPTVRQPSKTFRIDFYTQRSIGMIDKTDSVKQAILLTLNTERYQYLIYSWNYGVEFNRLFGENVAFACSEIERTAREALLQDDRILEVKDFKFDTSQRGKVVVTFTAITIYGGTEIQEEVTY